VVIATVFLTIIGMVTGFVLGERHRQNQSQGQGQPDTPVPSSFASADPTVQQSGTLCPQEMLAKSVELGFPGDLRQVLKIETDNATVVWICRDYADKLYYQSNTDGPDTAIVQGHNGLFLDNVTDKGGDVFEALAANKNEIEISREHLVVRFANGKATETHSVVRAE
jgi:hypothetical protein